MKYFQHLKEVTTDKLDTSKLCLFHAEAWIQIVAMASE
jgi:hypothetical protein